MRIYNFDPFKHIPKEQCTVGALRAQAKGVDTGYMETGRTLRSKVKEGQIVTHETYFGANT